MCIGKHTRLVRYLVFTICILFFACSFSAAQLARMDSLKQELVTLSNDTSKIDVLFELSFAHHQLDIVKCREYAEEALRISEKLQDNNRIALAHNYMGIAAQLEGNSAQAIDHWEKCLSLSKSTKFLEGEMKALNNLGLVQKEKGNIEESLNYFLSALKVHEETGEVKEEITILSNIGYLYLSVDDNDNAFKYLQLAVEKGEKQKNRSCLGSPYHRIGEYYVKQKDYETALSYLSEAYDICKEYAQDLRITSTLRLMGECQYYLGMPKKSRKSFIEAEEKLLTIGERYTELFALYNTWALICSELGNYEVAFAKANTTYDLAMTNNLETFKLSALQLLAKLHEKSGNFKDALYFQKAASEQHDMLDLRSKEELALELEAKYQSDKKQIAIELFKSREENTNAKLKAKNLVMLISGLIALLIAILAFQLYNANRTKQQYNDQLTAQVEERTKELESSNIKLKNSNMELERFAYIASHDLKTPLRNIISFTGLLERRLNHVKDEQIQEYFTFLKQGGKRMNFLIEDLLEYSKFSSSEYEGIREKVDLNVICKELKNTISHTLKERDADIQIDQQLPTIIGNYSSFFLLFKNLVENGIKYNESENPLVIIHYEKYVDTFSIFFKDNGIGIQEEFFDKIWEMFSRLHNHSKYEGTGLGLATCKKIMDSLNGNIDVSSTVDEGSIFELSFPSSMLIGQSEIQQPKTVCEKPVEEKVFS